MSYNAIPDLRSSQKILTKMHLSQEGVTPLFFQGMSTVEKHSSILQSNIDLKNTGSVLDELDEISVTNEK